MNSAQNDEKSSSINDNQSSSESQVDQNDADSEPSNDNQASSNDNSSSSSGWNAADWFQRQKEIQKDDDDLVVPKSVTKKQTQKYINEALEAYNHITKSQGKMIEPDDKFKYQTKQIKRLSGESVSQIGLKIWKHVITGDFPFHKLNLTLSDVSLMRNYYNNIIKPGKTHVAMSSARKKQLKGILKKIASYVNTHPETYDN